MQKSLVFLILGVSRLREDQFIYVGTRENVFFIIWDLKENNQWKQSKNSTKNQCSYDLADYVAISGKGLVVHVRAHLLGNVPSCVPSQENKVWFSGTAPKTTHPSVGTLGRLISLAYMKCSVIVNVFVFTSALEDAGVAVAVSLSKGLHHSINLLGLPRQTETPQELSA